MLIIYNILLHLLDPIFAAERSWDVAATCIALMSICIAIASFVIAIMTLISQKQTAKNTMPVITHEIQNELLDRLIVKIWDNHITLNALKIALDDESYAYYPSKEIMQELIIDTNAIHADLFYREPSTYRKVNLLQESIRSYNIMLNVIAEELSDSYVPTEFLRRNMVGIIKRNLLVAKLWSIAMGVAYEYNDIMKQKRLADVLAKAQKNIFDEIKEDISDPTLDGLYVEDYFVNLIKDKDQRKKMQIYMNIITSQMREELSERFIPKH